MSTSADPLILACGGSAVADAAAAELEAAGLGVRAVEPRAGVRLVAVEGCASACCSLRLESGGHAPAATVDASSVGDAVAAVRHQLESRHPRRHRVRPRPPASFASVQRAHTVRDYLVALAELTAPLVDCGAVAPGLPVVAAHVSRLLGVSRPTAGEMLRRLETTGLIARTGGRQIVLTAAGRAAADAAVRRHRLLEAFAVSYLGYDVADAFDRARALDDAFDDEAVRRLDVALGRPERCPHGWPIDPKAARAEASRVKALGDGVVVCVGERRRDVLRELGAHGIRPGARVDGRLRERLSPDAQAAVFV